MKSNSLAPTPAGRIATSLLLVAGVATAPERAWPAALALAALCLVLTRPRPAWFLKRALLGLLPLLAMTAALALDDTARALAVGARALAALVIALSMAGTLDLASLPGALRALGAPRALSATIHAMLWQLEHIADEGRLLVLARRLRGDARSAGPEVLAQLLIRTAARAERVDLAMRLRGADGLPPPRQRLRARDGAAIALGAGTVVALHVFG